MPFDYERLRRATLAIRKEADKEPEPEAAGFSSSLVLDEREGSDPRVIQMFPGSYTYRQRRFRTQAANNGDLHRVADKPHLWHFMYWEMDPGGAPKSSTFYSSFRDANEFENPESAAEAARRHIKAQVDAESNE